MRSTLPLIGLLIAPLALGQEAPSTPDLANPASFGTRQACLAECERVFTDCKAQCQDTSARAHEPHFEAPDLPVAQCIGRCEEDLGLCRQDC
ncbi:MAG: hypothetical protein ACM3ST_17770 [Bdellovibrio bacteriovorus]